MALMTFKGLLLASLILFCTTFIATRMYLFLVSKGLAVPIFNHYPGKCRVIPGIECGSEDFAVTKAGLVFISNGFRGITGCDRKTLTGNIYLFDFKNPAANVTKLEVISSTIDMTAFEPHGLSLWEKDDGAVLLFVVDHGISDRVQIFEYDRSSPRKLLHKETIINDKFICINDLVAMGERKFYVTNYLAYCQVSHTLAKIEALLSLATGNVVYYDGSQARIEASKLQMPNGINVSPDGRYVFVVGSTSSVLMIFARNIKNSSLTLAREIGLMALPDNVEVDRESGDLYIGTHRSQNIVFEDYNGPFAAPSQVLRVRASDAEWNDATIIEILSSDGINFIRGSSVASYYQGKLLVGTVFHRLALCEGVKIL